MATKIDSKIEFKVELKNALSKTDTPPFLFVGSGISIRYYSIPTWIGILKGFVEKNKNCFKQDFGYYSSKCQNNPLQIATMLAAEFHEYWWKSEEYVKSRKLNADTASNDIETAFKIELAHYVDKCKKINLNLEAEISLFSQSIISGILTTNWDDFLQIYFPDFHPKIGQKEAIFSDYKSIGELYKIHGCTSTPQSLIVTTKDYDKFIENNHYLNAKLLTLFAEFPILFIGYSLSDPNIEIILKNLISCMDKDLLQFEKLQNRLFFVEWQSEPCNPTIETSSYTSKNITIPLTKIKAHDYLEIWEVLSVLPRKLPIRTLRQLQKMVFDFVSTSNPTGKMLVHGLEELDEVDELEVVVGFGNISKLQNKGLVGLKGKDLMEDILFNKIPKENHLEIAQKVLPGIVRKNVFIPFFKYHRKINNLNENNSLKNYHYDNYTLKKSSKISINDYRISKIGTTLKTKINSYSNLNELISANSEVHAIQWIPLLDINKIDIKALRKFLKGIWPKYGLIENTYSSHYRKCICLLDYLEFANHE